MHAHKAVDLTFHQDHVGALELEKDTCSNATLIGRGCPRLSKRLQHRYPGRIACLEVSHTTGGFSRTKTGSE